MPTEIEERILCSELSGLFLAGEPRYDWIVEIASKCDLDYVENVLFNLVAPVLWYESYTTTPEIWGYQEEWLWHEIQKNRKKDKNLNFTRRIVILIRTAVVRLTIGKAWEKLKVKIEVCKASLPSNIS